MSHATLRYALGTTFSSVNPSKIVQVLECLRCKSRFKCEGDLDQFVLCPVCHPKESEEEITEYKETVKEVKRQRKKEFAAGLQE